MDIHVLEQLPRLVSQGKREGQRLAGAISGRHKERAIRDESIRPSEHVSCVAHRILIGQPTFSLAALLGERGLRSAHAPQDVIADVHPMHAQDGLAARLARWIPRFELLRRLAPEVEARLVAPDDEHFVWRFVLEVTLPDTRLVARDAPVRGGTRLLVVSDTVDLPLLHALRPGPWTACARDAGVAARVRRALLGARGAPCVDFDIVGGTPLEWTRRHIGMHPAAAMHAALTAFGAEPLAQGGASEATTARRRAGSDALLGEMHGGDMRTLVWVDPPGRRTGDPTLCRAVLQRERGATPWDRVVVLGWHFVPNFAQQLALRHDGRVDAYPIGLLPRAPGEAPRVDPAGFRRTTGLETAWAERKRTEAAGGHEWLTVRLGDAATFDDWAVDPLHDGDVFRGAWHAVRDGMPGQRAVRLRVPCHDGPRRVCVRAVDAQGGVSEAIVIVRESVRETVRERGPRPATAMTSTLC